MPQCLDAFLSLSRRVIGTHPEIQISSEWVRDWPAVTVSSISDVMRPAPLGEPLGSPRSVLPASASQHWPTWKVRCATVARLPGLSAMTRDFVFRLMAGKLAIGYLRTQPGQRCRCPYCPAEPETVAHAFLECPRVKAAAERGAAVMVIHGLRKEAFEQAWRYGWTTLHARSSPEFACVMLIVCILRYSVYRARCRTLYDADPPPTELSLWLTAMDGLRQTLRAAAFTQDTALCRLLCNRDRWLVLRDTWTCLL